MRRRAIGITAWGLIAFCTVQAQQYSFKNYSVEEGLRNTNVDSLFQDREGFLWIGTDARLYRYNGKRFDEYAWAARLPQTNINSLAEDSFGHLWVGTEAGVFLLDGGHFRAVTDNGRAMHTPSGHRIAPGPNGVMYVAEASQIVALSPDRTGNVWTSRLAIPAGATKSAGIAQVHGVAALKENELIFGCDRGMCEWVQGKLRKWGASSGLPPDDWRGILLGKSGDLWIHGFAHTAVLPLGSEHFIVRDPPRSLGNNDVPWIAEDASGRVLVNVGPSIARWEQSNWQFFTEENGLPHSPVPLLVDAEGTLWMGASGHGLYKWLGYDVWQNWTTKQGLGSDVVWAVQRDSTNRLWVGHDAGLSIWNDRQRRFESVPMPAGMKNDRIQCLTLTGRRTLWAGSLLGHLASIDITTRKSEASALGSREHSPDSDRPAR